MKISTQSYLTLAVLMPVILLIHPYIAAKETSSSSNSNLLTEDHFHLGVDFESEFSSMENQIAVTGINNTISANQTGPATEAISQAVQEEEGVGDESAVSFNKESVGTAVVVRQGRNYDGGYHHASPVHIDFSPIFLAIVPIALFLGAAAAFALATASSSSSSAAAAAQQQQQQQEAANNNNNANNANNNNNNAILAALIAAIVNNKGHSKAHKTIIYAYNVTKVHDWRRSLGDNFQFSVPKVEPMKLMSHFHRRRKYVKEEP